MKQVMACLVSQELTDIVLTQLSSRGDVNTVLKPDASEALQLMQLAGKFDAFVVEDGPMKKNFQTIKGKTKPGIPVIGIGDPQSLYAPEICFHPEDWQKLSGHLMTSLGEESASDLGYVSMPLSLFVHFDSLSVDVFLKMTKEGKPHWVRRFLSGENLEGHEIEAYRAKGVTEFWIEKDKIKDFSKKLLERLGERARSTLKGGVESLHEAAQVFSSMNEITQKMGVKGQMVSICESWMGEMTKECMKASNQDIKSWWEKLSQDPSLDFQFRLVRLTALLCTQHVMLTDWGSKEEQAQKLTGVAMFADMELHDPQWIHIRSAEAVAKLSPDQRLIVSGHAAFAAKKLQTVPFITKDLSLLVAQHHGHQTGEWFPDRVSPSVAPLALIYIACEEIAYASLMKPEVPIKQVYEEVLTRYKSTALRKPLEQMPAIFGW